MIVEATYTEGPVQADGRRYVSERYVDDRGAVYAIAPWLGSEDITLVMDARVAELNTQIAAKRAAKAIANGSLLPMEREAFRLLFRWNERMAIDALQASFEASPSFTAEQKSLIRSAFKDFETTPQITRPFNWLVIAMLDLFVQLGLITAERKAEIVSAGNG